MPTKKPKSVAGNPNPNPGDPMPKKKQTATEASATPSFALPNVTTPPPDTVIPSPPAGFVSPGKYDFTGCYPSARQLAAATTAIRDLAKFVNYVALLGSTVPSASTVSAALVLGMQWADVRALTDAWNAYVRAQYGMAWKDVQQLLEELRPVYLHAVAKNPEMATEYPGLTQLFAAPRAVAKQAVATKRKKAKADAAAALATAEAGAKVAPPAATPETEAPAPNKPVTVSV